MNDINSANNIYCYKDDKNNKDIDLKLIVQNNMSFVTQYNDNSCILSVFPKPLYINADAKHHLKNNPDMWDDFIIMQSYDGPIIQMIFDNLSQKWLTVSEHSLYANEYYGKNKTISDILLDTNKLTNNILDKLDKTLCYTFIILHNRYKNIVQYNNLQNNYTELVLFNVSVKGSPATFVPLNTLYNNDIELYSNFIKMSEYNFSCYDEFENSINKISHDNLLSKKITTEGFIFWNIKKNYFIKIQTDIYININTIKSSNKNNYRIYLNLYQKDKLTDFLPYVSKYTNEIINRINISMKTLSKEFLNIYHVTRHKNNKELYNSLTELYKKILFQLHGIYIYKRKNEFNHSNISNSENISISDLESKSISVHDIYHYLKTIPFDQLYQIYIDRLNMINNPLLIPNLNVQCIYTLTQTQLMIPNE